MFNFYLQFGGIVVFFATLRLTVPVKMHENRPIHLMKLYDDYFLSFFDIQSNFN